MVPIVSEMHKNFDFIKLLKKNDVMYSIGDVIRIICDDYLTYKYKEVQNYLATKSEESYAFVFTLAVRLF